jgi:hypothetical protein
MCFKPFGVLELMPARQTQPDSRQQPSLTGPLSSLFRGAAPRGLPLQSARSLLMAPLQQLLLSRHDLCLSWSGMENLPDRGLAVGVGARRLR